MRDKFFLLSALLIIIFIWFIFGTFSTTSQLRNPSHKLQSSIQDIVNIASPSSQISEVNQTLFEIGKSNIESSNSTLGTVLNMFTAMLTIIALGFGAIAFLTNDKFKEMDRLLIDTKKKYDEVTALSQETARSSTPSSLSPSVSPSSSPSPSHPPEEESFDEASNVVHQPIEWVKLYHFEKVYRTIFGSQLIILKSLHASPNKTISEAILQAIHRRSRYADLPFNDYINYLINSYLIVKNENQTYTLTLLGEEFLQYLFQNGIQDKVD